MIDLVVSNMFCKNKPDLFVNEKLSVECSGFDLDPVSDNAQVLGLEPVGRSPYQGKCC